MADVNKKVLVEKVVAKHENLTKKEATEIIDQLLSEITKAVKGKKKVDLAGFGKFELKHRKARTGINPATKQKIKIAATNVPTFKPAKAFKDLVK